MLRVFALTRLAMFATACSLLAANPANTQNLDHLLNLGYRVVSVAPGEKVGDYIAFVAGERSLYACRVLISIEAGSIKVNFFDRFDVCQKLNRPAEESN